jgi:hypothetical protein
VSVTRRKHLNHLPLATVLLPHGVTTRPSLIGALIAACLTAAPVHAQTPAPLQAPGILCLRGEPRPNCDEFAITEVSYAFAIASTSAPRSGTTTPSDADRADFRQHVTVELGQMYNRSPLTALGYTGVLGVDNGRVRVGAKGRYRRWLTPDGPSLDISAGPVIAYLRNTDGPMLLLSTDVSYNFYDYGALTARLEMGQARGRTPTALYTGLRLGSKPAIASLMLAMAVGGFVFMSRP